MRTGKVYEMIKISEKLYLSLKFSSFGWFCCALGFGSCHCFGLSAGRVAMACANARGNSEDDSS
jgi:hypothetical protein